MAERRGGVRAIVLDFNGTLAQDDDLVAPIFVDTFASVGAALTVEEYHRDLAALPDRQVFDLALARAGLPLGEGHRDALIQERVDAYLAAVARTQPINDDAIAFVRAASGRRVPLAIASGAFRREIEFVLLAAGVSEHFGVVVSIDDVTHGKPHPEGFLLALTGLNELLAADPPIQAFETVAVEDATGGASAARAAGMRVAALRGPGYDPASGHANVIIDRLDPAALEAIMGLAW